MEQISTQKHEINLEFVGGLEHFIKDAERVISNLFVILLEAEMVV